MSIAPQINEYSLDITIDDTETQPTWQRYSIGGMTFRAQVFGVVTVRDDGGTPNAVVLYLGGGKK